MSAEMHGDTWLCRVSVDHSGQRTRHLVTVTPSDIDRWLPLRAARRPFSDGSDREDIERLVEESFGFLLEREPPSAILATFDLAMIQRYFPDYDSAFKRP